MFISIACNQKSSKKGRLAAFHTNKKYQTWEVVKGDKASSSYSKLKQINTRNIDHLQIAWSFHPDDVPARTKKIGKAECNPIIVNETMFLTSGRHVVYALDATNGHEIWSFEPYSEEGGRGVNRGVTYWADDKEERILFTADNYLFAVNANTGQPISSFGKDGKVNLNIGLGVDPDKISVRVSSEGMVYQDLIILGSQLSEQYGEAPGYIRAYNIRTGKLEWTFHTIPKPGERGYETWPKNAWKYTGGVNNWAGMSLDKKRGWVFLPLGSPTYDYYGGNRKGKNLYGNSLLVLNAKTGKYIWHFQTVHHDLWDYDLPAPPNLVTVNRDGKEVDAVAQLTKTGFLFLFDRENGEPLFSVEERKVPVSHLPGEQAWPTQPFPLQPKPYSRQKVTSDEITERTPEAHTAVTKQLNQLRHEGIFTPPDSVGTLYVPGFRGGTEWGGGAFDPVTGILYFNANNWPTIVTLRKQKNKKMQSVNKTIYERGEMIYMDNCATCHGTDKRGKENVIPSLFDLKSRMTKKQVRERIKKGGGRMPPFASILNIQEVNQIVAYLFNIKKSKKGQVSHAKGQVKHNQRIDTTDRYKNITAYKHFEDPEGYHAIKPPWGTLNAINLNTGKYVWKKPLGNIPELQQDRALPTGLSLWGGPIVTAGGLIFVGAQDKKFRAFDKETGKLLWEAALPGPMYSTPATFMIDGKQYVVVTVTGTKDQPGGAIITFSLP